MNMEHVGIALEIMGKGMGGIFAAIIIIMLRESRGNANIKHCNLAKFIIYGRIKPYTITPDFSTMVFFGENGGEKQ